MKKTIFFFTILFIGCEKKQSLINNEKITNEEFNDFPSDLYENDSSKTQDSVPVFHIIPNDANNSNTYIPRTKESHSLKDLQNEAEDIISNASNLLSDAENLFCNDAKSSAQNSIQNCELVLSTNNYEDAINYLSDAQSELDDAQNSLDDCKKE